MKILCDRSQLQEAFSFVAGVAPQKTPKPIIQNVLLDATKDGLTLYATDFELSARVAVDSVKIEKPGKVLLPARETSALLKELSDPTLTLKSKEFRCTIESGGGSFILMGDDPEQFPSTNQVEGGEAISMKAGTFLDLVKKTVFAAAREESRYMINGVLFDCRDDCLRMVATDGRRLALNYHNFTDSPTPTIKCVVPIRALQMVSRALGESSPEDVEMIFSDNQVRFSHAGSSLTTQLLECNFPDYEVVIPKAAQSTCEINKNLMESNVRKVAILSSGDLRVVRMNFSSQSLEMSAENSGVGRADQIMDIDMKGPGGSLSFNPDYVLEALKVCDTDVVQLGMSDDSTPAKLTLGESFTYILMPISGS
jgi:DNA polymerase-3 subunit beta